MLRRSEGLSNAYTGKHAPQFCFAVFITCLVLFALPVQAIDVEVNPGSFTGEWSIQSAAGVGFESGARTVSLDPGTHQFLFSIFGKFAVNVAADGNVSVLNGVSGIGGVGTLTFNTVSITINPGSYSGQYAVARVDALGAGVRSVELVPGLINGYYMGGISSSGNGFSFTVAADRTVDVVNGISGVGGLGSLTLNTVPTLIDTGAFLGEWRLLMNTDFAPGPATVHIVPGVRQAMAVAGVGGFFFSVLGDRTVSVSNPVSATGSYETLTFNTLPIWLDANGFPGAWAISRLPLGQGSATVHLVPDVHYLIFVGAGNTGIGANFGFDVAADGTVTSNNSGISLNSDTPMVMQFNTRPIEFTTNWPMSWQVRGLGGNETYITLYETEGNDTINLIAGLRYYLQPGNQTTKEFIVTATAGDLQTCGVVPGTIEWGPSYSFSIGCGELDGDGDGLPDSNDNCPNQANSDQVDFDQDGLGDLCDADLDGDGWPNDDDNCPNAVNPSQTDLDSDGIGDVCDTDVDEDSVPDTDDNCIFIPNTDQGDSDLDGEGDACDLDDDGDGVDDIVDNCPLIANADQADFDGDGEGDMCDGDLDSDGVPNETDLCSLSPGGDAVNDDGCTGAQFIAESCVREDFVQHGQYVSCVAHAAQEAVDQGLISPNEKSRFVRDAAKKP